jgi:hypothetical protein
MMAGAHFRPEYGSLLHHNEFGLMGDTQRAATTPSTRESSPCEPTGRAVEDGLEIWWECRCSEGVALGAEAFEIIVKGRLTPTLVAALEGFELSHYDHSLTYLVGWVPDQARLHSVLSVLRDINVELKSVNAVKSADPALDRPGDTT